MCALPPILEANRPAEAVSPAMPSRAIAEDNVDAVLPLDGLAAAIVALVQGHAVYGGQAAAFDAGT